MDEKEETKVIRKKATLACDSCRKLKIRCDCNTPCAPCKRHSRLCIFSPRKRRGPPKGVNPLEEKVREKFEIKDSLASNVLKSALNALLGHLFSFVDKDVPGLINSEFVNKGDLSKPEKLQLFAALACSARSCGNTSFSEKLYGYACQIARDLYDNIDSRESAYSAALGFFLLSLASIQKRKAILYISSSKALLASFPPWSTEMEEVKSLIEFSALYTSPSNFENSLTFLPANNNPYATLTLHQACPLNISDETAKIFRFILSNDSSDSRLNSICEEYFNNMTGINALEFIYTLKRILYYYWPNVSDAYSSEKLTEEFLDFDFSRMPQSVTNSMLMLLREFQLKAPPKVTFFSIHQAGVIRSLLWYSLGNIDQSCLTVNELVKCIFEPTTLERVMICPAYSIPPGTFLLAGLFLQRRLFDQASQLMSILQLYAKIGHLNAMSGMEVLEKYKVKKSLSQNYYPPTFSEQEIPLFTKSEAFSKINQHLNQIHQANQINQMNQMNQLYQLNQPRQPIPFSQSNEQTKFQIPSQSNLSYDIQLNKRPDHFQQHLNNQLSQHSQQQHSQQQQQQQQQQLQEMLNYQIPSPQLVQQQQQQQIPLQQLHNQREESPLNNPQIRQMQLQQLQQMQQMQQLQQLQGQLQGQQQYQMSEKASQLPFSTNQPYSIKLNEKGYQNGNEDLNLNTNENININGGININENGRGDQNEVENVNIDINGNEGEDYEYDEYENDVDVDDETESSLSPPKIKNESMELLQNFWGPENEAAVMTKLTPFLGT